MAHKHVFNAVDRMLMLRDVRHDLPDAKDTAFGGPWGYGSGMSPLRISLAVNVYWPPSLTARNVDVDELNIQTLLTLGDGDKYILTAFSDANRESADGVVDISDELTPQYLRSLSVNGLPLGDIRLRLGAPVMFLRNLDPLNGLCNGTRMIVTSIRQRFLQVSS
ncbi:uncharacterized protein N7515_007077 [Penicillium bovifimosum]|uniref:DNA helicase Pif1-like 2B domain-containing protein n=1 Tax=Penicillium bovifimosum TaxID=126998 RepID=A0A9W9GW55_9EURO|nr:uncharacterized protein N7515_007077 [Penicillium bovifimosum]KAJ5131038.1 hypothetical protein N7515_007077 [Penicillium bovifimosum]